MVYICLLGKLKFVPVALYNSLNITKAYFILRYKDILSFVYLSVVRIDSQNVEEFATESEKKWRTRKVLTSVR